MSDSAGTSATTEEICNICKGPSKLRCSGCKSVYYCNREHQKNDWKSHSKKCQAYELAENSIVGRHYVATRDIHVDEIIFSENKPLLVALNVGATPACLGCYAPLTPWIAKDCAKCGWPLCRTCTKHGPECELTIKYRKSKINMNTYDLETSIHNAIMILRAIHLRNNNPRDYRKFMKLQDHNEELLNEDGTVLIIPLAACDVRAHMKIDDLDLTEIMKIMGIMSVNAFKNLTPERHHRSVVFDKVSYLAHDCHPNCTWNSYYDANNEARMVVRAIRKISKGDPITLTYTSCMDDTIQRRLFLKKGKFFDCMCKRCKDPTDLGTMFSAIKCFRTECNGYMLPPTFLVSGKEKVPDFVCNKCSLTTPSAKIDIMIEDITRKYSDINYSNENQLRQFIDEQSKILHENHRLIIEAELKLISTMNPITNKASSSIKVLKENIKLCKKLNSLLEILEPASTEARGMILISQFHQTTLLQSKQRLQSHQFEQSLMESKFLLNEAVRLTSHLPEEAPGSAIAKLARMQLQGMNKICL